ncbi:MAG: cytidine deaminase [Clostridia bacterium]|nr:cytidine deaminase [Clostridia bacterium]
MEFCVNGKIYTDKDLYLIAKDMLQYAYAPFSKFCVGAALLGNDGKVYTGVNVENSSFGATICAERTAVTKAVSEGCRSFAAIAIASSGGEAWPCGICRQVLYEFCDILPVITGEDEDHLKVMDITQLLKEGFRL